MTSDPTPASRSGAPLAGRTVVVTRAPHQARDLRVLLEERGARVLVHPTIRVGPAADPGPLLTAAREVASYDWLLFTSVNAVAAFRGALEEVNGGVVPPFPPELRSCAIGPATAQAMEEELGVRPDVIPDEYVAEAVLEALEEAETLAGRRILLPRAAEAREVLPEGLEARGAHVDVVEAYRTVSAGEDLRELRGLLGRGAVDLLTFTASSTVRSFHDHLGSDVGGAGVAVIGPITESTARELGIPVDVVAEEYTIPGLVEACVRWAGRS